MSINSGSYNTLFISETALKNASIVNANVDMKTLTPTIKLCQDKYLMPVLGSSLYSDLQNKIASGSLNTNERFLIDAYLQPCLTWAILNESTIYMSYKYMNKGVSQQTSEFSNAPTLKELQFIADKEKSNFDFYSQRLINYLCANKTLYPTYNVETNIDDTKPSHTGFSSRLYLGDSKSDYRCH